MGCPTSVFKTGAIIQAPPRFRELRARDRDRTCDILIKSQTLYQLSYSRKEILAVRMGLEPMTSTLTMWRSNRLN